ncbi:MAG TPA: SDR family oxidoreductase, partial [Planctomycetota bacterium]|nr:SDR family oxidoreductase [Planctomycetota bacterium]
CVTIADRDAKRGAAVAAELPGARFKAVDITQTSQIEELAAEMRDRAAAGGIHALVNSVGIFDERRTLLKTEIASLRRMMEVNVFGAFQLTQILEPLLAPNASVVHIGSVNGKRASAGLAAYKTSKAALNMMMRCIALELAADPRRIRVNIVAPGWVDTPGERQVWAQQGRPEFLDNADSVKGIPLGRRQTPEDIANMVSFVCSEQASNIAGQILYVDGGMSAP